MKSPSMRVAMYYSNSDVRVLKAAIPQIASDEALVRIEASGICGTDTLEWYRRDKVPLVLGHEIAGKYTSIDGFELGLAPRRIA